MISVLVAGQPYLESNKQEKIATTNWTVKEKERKAKI